MQRTLGMVVLFLSFSLVTMGGLMPRYPIQPVESAPIIDGKLDDACWKTLPELGTFVNDQNQAAMRTTVRIGRDARNLYVGAFLAEPEMGKIRDRVKVRDGGVWGDDSLSVMILPGLTGSHFVFTVNPSGVMEDGHDNDPVTIWNTAWQAKTSRSANGWSVEMAIPFSSVTNQPPGPSTEWRINVGRYRAHVREVSAWSSPKGGFHNIDQYGEVYFPPQALLRDIRLVNRPQRVGAESEIQVTGQPARYRTRWWWYVNGKDPVLKYGGLEVKAGAPDGEKQTFTEDGESCHVQAELFAFAPPCPCLYRTDWIAVKSVDPLTLRIQHIKTLMAQISRLPVHAMLADLRPTWPSRSQTLEKKPDELISRQLYQELRVAKWLGTNPQTSPTLWFTRLPFTDSDYDDLPAAGEIGSTVKIRAMRDEFEPGCVNLLPLAGDLRVKIEPEDLRTSAGDVLPAGSLDVRVLKNWYQSGRDSVDRDGRGLWMAELLVKNDEMVRCDHLKRRNIQISKKDGPELRPVSIPRLFTRQFWLTVHVPKNQKPGAYRGFAKAVADGKELVKIPVEVTVLPLTMEPTAFTWTMYYSGQHTKGKDPALDRRYIGDLKSMAEHGFTAAAINDKPVATVKEGLITRIDYSSLRYALELRRRFGLTGKTVFQGYDAYMGPIDMIHRQPPEAMAGVPSLRANWIFYSKGLKQLGEELGFKGVYIYGMDEPGYDTTGANMKREKFLCQWSHEAGIKISSAITLAGAESLPGLLDVPVLDVPSVRVDVKRRKLPLPEAWLYWHPIEDTRRDRLMAGLLLWYGGYQGACPWVYQMMPDEWDDWKGANGYRQESYVYPGEDGPIPTWQYEAFREGVDDVKYLEMLERRVKKARAMKLSSADQKVVAQADQLLNVPPEKFRGTYYTAPGKVTPADLAAFRDQAVTLLVRLNWIITNGN